MKAFILAFALLSATLGAASNLQREPGSIYLEDLALKPVKLVTIAEATVANAPVEGRYLGTIRKGATVELVAIIDGQFRVRGQAQQGGVVGWVDQKVIQAVKPEFIASVQKNAKRKAEVDALVSKGEVALNMTADEVSTALGRAQKKTSKIDAGGRKDVWEFVRYARVPQETTSLDRNGRLVNSIVYVKVAAGKLTVTFQNQLVSELEQSEGNTDVQAPVRLVPAPVVVAW